MKSIKINSPYPTLNEEIYQLILAADICPSKPNPQPQTRMTPTLRGMKLVDEIDRVKRNPPWPHVTRVLNQLDPGHFNSFACLSLPGNSYVQCLRGFNGWHLEWRTTEQPGKYTHYRASRPSGSKKSFELKNYSAVSQGQHRDLLDFDDVLLAFRFFHQNRSLPTSLKWRKINI